MNSVASLRSVDPALLNSVSSREMALNWSAIWNRVFKLIDAQGASSYHSGSRFIKAVQEVDPYFPNYTEYIEQRRRADQSTTRRDFYRDIFLGLDEPGRFKLVTNILNEVQSSDPILCTEIRTMMAGGISAPSATVPQHACNGDRLNEYLKGMDGAIAAGDYERTVTMAYTCLEGFLGAFVRAKSPRASYPNEIVALSKEVCDHLPARHIARDNSAVLPNLRCQFWCRPVSSGVYLREHKDASALPEGSVM